MTDCGIHHSNGMGAEEPVVSKYEKTKKTKKPAAKKKKAAKKSGSTRRVSY